MTETTPTALQCSGPGQPELSAANPFGLPFRVGVWLGGVRSRPIQAQGIIAITDRSPKKEMRPHLRLLQIPETGQITHRSFEHPLLFSVVVASRLTYQIQPVDDPAL